VSPGVVASALVVVLAAAVYLPLTPAVSGDGDGSEFTLVLSRAGVAHPTGYPLYTLFGALFSWILRTAGVAAPLSANLWSVLGSVAALVLLHALALSLVPSSERTPAASRAGAVAGFLPVALLALNPAWIIVTTQAEVYSWHVAWVLGTALVFMRISREAGAGELDDRSWRRAAIVWGLLGGVGLAHHATSLAVFLPLSAGILAVRGRDPGGDRHRGAERRPSLVSLVALAFGAFLLPLMSYLFIYWRAFHPGVVHWPDLEPSFGSFWAHVSGAGYRSLFGHFAPSRGEESLLERAVYPILAAGCAGMALVLALSRARAERIAVGSLAVAIALQVVAAFQYGVFDVSSYFLAPEALALAALGPALLFLIRRSGLTRLLPAAVAAALVVIAGAGWIQPAWHHEAQERRRHLLEWERTARNMWSSLPDRPAVFLWAADACTRFVEYQIIDHQKTAIYVGNPTSMVAGPVRRDFEKRFGVDPLIGIDTVPVPTGSADDDARMAAFEWTLAQDLNRRLAVPVIYFDFRHGRIMELPKSP
jgi:hypothetical protein